MLRCLREACGDGQLLVDLFVNYDCDLNSSNLFERLVNGLVRAARGLAAAGVWGPWGVSAHVSSWLSAMLMSLHLFSLAQSDPQSKHTAVSPGSSNHRPHIVCRAPQVKMAQAPLPTGGDYTALQQEQWLRQEALQVGARGFCWTQHSEPGFWALLDVHVHDFLGPPQALRSRSALFVIHMLCQCSPRAQCLSGASEALLAWYNGAARRQLQGDDDG